MPFRSKAQQGYLYAKHPEIAKHFAEKTDKGAYSHLPEHVNKKKKHAEMAKKMLKNRR